MNEKRETNQATTKKIAFPSWRFSLFDNRNQLIGFVFFLIVTIVLFWGTISVIHWINDSKRVLLSRLTIIGNRQFTTDADIRQAIKSLGRENTFIDQDVEAIQQEIQRLPWIKRVNVKKKWPDQLLVRILEYRPSAYWNDAYLLDDNGVMFSIAAQRYSSPLPKLYGPENTEQSVMKMYKYIKNLLKKNVKQRIPYNFELLTVSVNERYSWIIQVAAYQEKWTNKKPDLYPDNQTIKIVLGREQIGERLQRFMLLYPVIKAQTSMQEYIATIDLRYSNGASVQRRRLGELSF